MKAAITNRKKEQDSNVCLLGTVLLGCYVSLYLLCRIARNRVFHMEIPVIYYIFPILVGALVGSVLVLITRFVRKKVEARKPGQIVWLELILYSVWVIVCCIWMQTGYDDGRIADYGILGLVLGSLMVLTDLADQIKSNVIQWLIGASVLFINGYMIEALSVKITLAILITLAEGLTWCLCTVWFRHPKRPAWRCILRIISSTIVAILLMIWTTGHWSKVWDLQPAAGETLWNIYITTGEMPISLENGNYMLTLIREELGIWGISAFGVLLVVLSVVAVKAIYQLIHDDLKKDAAIVFGIFSIYAVLSVFQVLTEAGTFVCPYIYWPDARIGMPLCTFICGTLITKYHGRQNIYDK